MDGETHTGPPYNHVSARLNLSPREGAVVYSAPYRLPG